MKFNSKHSLSYVIALTLVVGSFGLAVSKSHSKSYSMSEFEKAMIDVAETISPSVVSVSVEKTLTRQQRQQEGFPFPFGEDFFERFFESPQPRNNQAIRGGGSGFIVSKKGHIITNHHVVNDADEVTVTLADDREFEAEVIGSDPRTDVGVIQIDANNLKALKFGSSENLKVGQWVMAVGNPVNLSHTITTGVVSAKGRSTVGITDVEDFIQTDAAINRGNSGGPLIDLSGKVVGINTAIVSRTGGYMGIAFAIPIDMAEKVYEEILEHGDVKHGYLGIMISPLTEDLAQAFNVDTSEGILIQQVSDNSPASQAGLKRGDVIVQFDGEKVEEVGEFRNKVAFLEPGTTFEINIIRAGQRQTKEVTIGRYPETEMAMGEEDQKAKTFQELGFTVQNLSSDLAERFGYENQNGVIVSQVNPTSDAAEQGIRPGLLIKEVNQKPVQTVDQFRKQIQNTPEDKPVLLYVYDGGYSSYITLRINQE